MTKQKDKPCDPDNCTRFKQRYERTWDRVPADIHIVRCPFRIGNSAKCGYQEGQNLMGG